MSVTGDPVAVLNNPEAASEAFCDGALRRIHRLTLLFGIAGMAIAWWVGTAASAAGLALGVLISWLNFRWLEKVVAGLGRRIVESHSNDSGAGAVASFLVRYLLMGMVVYVIFTGWPAAFRGLLWGLCLPIAAMMGEAAVETYVALRSRSDPPQ